MNENEFQDIAEKLRLKKVTEQSSITIPPQHSVGDLPTIFNQMFNTKNIKTLSFINKKEAVICALLSAMSRVKTDTPLEKFVEYFLEDYLSLKSSIKGYRSKQISNICAGNVELERKLEYARLKNKEKEDFV